MSLVRLDYGLAARASQILDDILRTSGGQLAPELVSRFKGLPAMIRTSGLPATLAFFYAKSAGEGALPEAYKTARVALIREIVEELKLDAPPQTAPAFFVLLGDPAEVSPGDLARITARTEELAVWLRRLTEATEHATTTAPAGAADA